jgi:hypothetical protein
MAGNDTAALVVALSAQLTKFERDMKSAGDTADRTASGIEDRFSKLNLSTTASALGNLFANFTTKGIEAAIQFLTDLRDRFLELPGIAKLVGESLNDVWGFQEAAANAKVPIDDATKSLKGLAVLLDQMQRGEKNSLSELFDANPAALQGANREALTLQQTFGVVADLVQNARTEIQKIDIGKAAGQADTMVKFLQQGGEAVTRLANDAAAAAPDLQKLADQAKAFDDAWNQATKNVKSYLSEHMFDVISTDLTDLIALLGGAVKFLGLFRNGLIDGAASKAAGEIEQLRQVLLRFQQTKTVVDESAGLDTSATARDDRRRPAAQSAGQNGTSTRDNKRGLSNVPLKPTADTGETKDSFDRTEEQITKHTASMNADTIAVFQNNAAQAQLRAEFQLLNAIRKDEGEVTQAQIDQYEKLRASMSAEQALKQAAIDLTPAHKASFIAAAEGAKTATANYDAARESLSKINSASSQVGSALSTAFADAVVEGKSLNDVMSSLLKTLEKAAINSLFSSFFNPTSAGGLSSFASLLGLGARAGGGPVSSGQAYVVGEKQPEIFVPNQSGTIIPQIPTVKGGGGGSNVSFGNTIINGSGLTQEQLSAAITRSQVDTLRRVPGIAVGAVAQQQYRMA